MNTLDQQLAAAVDDLRAELDSVSPPPFKPNRPAVPLVAVLVLLLGIGVTAFVARSRADDTGGVAVVTQPESTEIESPEVGPEEPVASDESPADPADPTTVMPAPTTTSTGVPTLDQIEEEMASAGESTATARFRALTSPQPGEYFVPVSTVGAWSADETKVIVYRTGTADPAHLVFDTLDQGDASPIELPFTPPDTEQIYWHPLADDQLIYATGADLMIFDLATSSSVIETSFDGCDSVDSGVLPVAPADDGTVSLLCRSSSGLTQLSYSLATGTELRTPTMSDTAAVPSPSGDFLVRWNDDGSGSVLDRSLDETGYELDLQNNHFGFVLAPDGVEWVATTLFDGPTIGSVVLLALEDGASPIVVIGPERGDQYPPSGTILSTAGNKLAVSIRGADDGLAGQITVLDFADSLSDPLRRSMAHRSAGVNGYWSTPFVSLSPSGVFIYSTDEGADSVTTWVGNFIE